MTTQSDRRLEDYATATRRHPDERARARCACALLRLERRETSVAAIRAVASDVSEAVASEVLEEGPRGAMQHVFELSPERTRKAGIEGFVVAVQPRT